MAHLKGTGARSTKLHGNRLDTHIRAEYSNKSNLVQVSAEQVVCETCRCALLISTRSEHESSLQAAMHFCNVHLSTASKAKKWLFTQQAPFKNVSGSVANFGERVSCKLCNPCVHFHQSWPNCLSIRLNRVARGGGNLRWNSSKMGNSFCLVTKCWISKTT